jgi:hypothetical protein
MLPMRNWWRVHKSTLRAENDTEREPTALPSTSGCRTAVASAKYQHTDPHNSAPDCARRPDRPLTTSIRSASALSCDNPYR